MTIYGNLGDHGQEHLSAFAVAKAGIARFTEILATELVGTPIVAVCAHPGFVRTPMTEHLAASADGRRRLPSFGQRANRDWGDGTGAVALIRRIGSGDADALSGRIVYTDDNLAPLTTSSVGTDARRLRIRPPS